MSAKRPPTNAGGKRAIRMEAAGHVPPRRKSATTRARHVTSKRQQLFAEAQKLATKVYRSGDWSKHATDMKDMVENVWARNDWSTDADQFLKRLLIDINSHAPWEFYGRIKSATDLFRARYGLDDEQIKKLRAKFVQQGFVFFIQNAEAMLPVFQELIDTRLAGKPFTPEQVARWSKVLRPIATKTYQTLRRDVQTFAEQNLTPQQRSKVEADLKVFDTRTADMVEGMAEWQRGEWSPAEWGLDTDPVHVAMQRQLDGKAPAGELASKSSDPTKAAERGDPSQAKGPMRIGDSRRYRMQSGGGDESRFPDESTWVQYVREFCDRYQLDKAQRASAFAILKDLQKRAQAYRASRADDIKKLQARVRNADSAEDRGNAQADLQGLLQGIEVLFEELKGRLENIPSARQRRAG